MTTALVSILVALIAGPISIVVTEKIRARQARKHFEAEVPHLDRTEARQDFELLSKQQQRLIGTLTRDVARERAQRAEDRNECKRQIAEVEERLKRETYALRMRIVELESQLPVPGGI